ncbi:MAG: hypothetical protein E6417_05910, partial [Bradyrhizobium sp.]|nr:hypothetical protein [Bradyrhizobium sp.]
MADSGRCDVLQPIAAITCNVDLTILFRRNLPERFGRSRRRGGLRRRLYPFASTSVAPELWIPLGRAGYRRLLAEAEDVAREIGCIRRCEWIVS